jgi:hypothetical protein
MVKQKFPPCLENPCVVQINYDGGDIGFYCAESHKDAVAMYIGKIVAIFKPKSITSSVINDTAQTNQLCKNLSSTEQDGAQADTKLLGTQ